MSYLNIDDTITAISTPLGKGGIGIVRLSGPYAVGIADKIFKSYNGKPVATFKSFSVHYGWVVEKNKQNKEDIVDEVLLSVMKAPKSYTMQDVIEISCHSGIVVLKRILDLLVKNGARLADPGEFTQRAFINGRIDLTQAEAILDLVQSKTVRQADIALKQLKGKLYDTINSIKQELVDIYTQIEAFIEFPEDVSFSVDIQEIRKKINSIKQRIHKLIKDAEKGQLFREGVSLVLCGSPNVGKSSLMNALLRKDRVIVTPIPGTTRDVIEETISIKGIPFRLIDTAGIIKANDMIEKEGIKRSKRHIEESDIILFVIDSSRKFTFQDEKIAKKIKDKKRIIILNKIDLPKHLELKNLKKYINTDNIVKVSALKEKGIDNLEKLIVDIIWQDKDNNNFPNYDKEDIFISNRRHIESLLMCLEKLKRIDNLPCKIDNMDLMAEDVKNAIDSLSEITGEIFTEDILEKIFSQFCIGK